MRGAGCSVRISALTDSEFTAPHRMTRSAQFRQIRSHALRRFVPLGMLAIASYAHAGWTLVRADAPVTIIHATSVYQAEAGQRLSVDDIVENPSGGVVQLQDEGGNIVALGHDTKVLLARDAHVALLRGWLKLVHMCTVANCDTPIVETERTRFTPVDRTALVIAATPADYDNADAVFCESGSAQVFAPETSRGKPARVQVNVHQFALRAGASDTITVSASPDPAFVATMPVMFRDALRPLPMPLAAYLRNVPDRNARLVSYADISQWLVSTLAVRTDPATRFVNRFRARLTDPAFRRDIRQHVRDLPEWRVLVFPPPRLASRGVAFEVLSAYPTTYVRP